MKFDRFDAAGGCIRHKLRALGFGRIVHRQHVFPLKLNLHLPRFDKPGNRRAPTEPVAPKTRRCILERSIIETSVVVEFQRKTANARNHLGQRGPRFNIVRGDLRGVKAGGWEHCRS